MTVDAKSLFDAVNNVGTSRPSCKRTCMEVAIIREVIDRSGHKLLWVPTGEMLADCLTKAGQQATRMLEILGMGKYCLTEVQSDVINFVGWIVSHIFGE